MSYGIEGDVFKNISKNVYSRKHWHNPLPSSDLTKAPFCSTYYFMHNLPSLHSIRVLEMSFWLPGLGPFTISPP